MITSLSLIDSIKKLKKAKIKNPHFEAEILLAHVLKKTREYILTYPDKKISRKQNNNFNSLISRRIKGEPIAYLIGYKEFYGLKFKVDKNVLVPRPETELIIEEVLHLTKEYQQPTTFIDIGTGSGCIIITLAKLFRNKDCKFFASDISKSALKIAGQNAKNYKLDKKIIFQQGDLLEPIQKKFKKKQNLIITANLPYLTTKQIKKSPTIQTEPKLALLAGNNGLRYYKKLFKQIKQFDNYKLPITILCEIDPSQTSIFKKLTKQFLLKSIIKIKKDLSGHNRLAIISIKN